MDKIRELGALAVASRLRRLTERLMRDGAQVYEEQLIDFEPRWFPIFILLSREEPMAVTDLARALGLTHPAVIQITRDMARNNLIRSLKDKSDARKRLLTLSDDGKALLPTLEPLWDDFEGATHELFEEIGHDLIAIIDKMEDALDRTDMTQRILARVKHRQYVSIEIVDYQPKYATLFRSLNFEWLDRYFGLEPDDESVLDYPEERILQPGGAIFFALLEGKVIGTCALIKHEEGVFEMAKMAVSEAFQGQQAGQKLAETAIDRAQELNAHRLYLVTSKKLVAATALYRKLGFVVTTDHPEIAVPYQRSSFVMKMDFTSEKA